MARQLRKAGWRKARALLGGWAAWQQAGLPVEPKGGTGDGPPAAPRALG